MSGWAQRDAERKEDEAMELEHLRSEIERLTKANERLVTVGHKHGWNGVENSKILATFFDDEIERLTRERDEARAAIESDRTKLADAVTEIDKALDSRFWLTEGRGSYAWDDDRYRQEFRDAATEILGAIKSLRSLAADWSNSPMSGAEVAQARIDLKAERDQLREQLAALTETRTA